MRYETVTEPSGEPVSLAAAKYQARELGTDEDAYFTGTLIPAARRATENYLRRPLRAAKYKALPDDGELRSPLVIRGYGPAVVTAITYLDGAAARQTLPTGTYCTRQVADGMRIEPIGSWPAGTAFEIEFDAGFAAVPEDIGLAMLLLIGEMFLKREMSALKWGDAELRAYDWLLDPYRCGTGL